MSWNNFKFALPSQVTASLTTRVACVSRIPGSMELWFIGEDGSVWDWYWYEGGSWETFRLAPPGSASPTGGIAAVSRIPTSMELWYVASNGSVHDWNWYQGSIWQTFQLAPLNSAIPTGEITAVSRIPTSMELWYVAPDGSVHDWYWYQGSNWQTFQLAPPGSASTTGGIAAVSRIPTSMELWYVGAGESLNDWNWYEAAVAAPGAGLGSNSNYFLYSNCNNLLGLSVTIQVTQDIVGSDGFGFQINAYSAKSDHDGAQQYLIYLDPGSSPPQLNCMVDNWQTAGGTQLINHIVKLATLTSQDLPTGYMLSISLENDASGNVVGATYSVAEEAGASLGSVTLSLPSISGVTSADLDPIVAFQLDFVGYLNGQNTALSSGAGKIIYAASTPLSALSSEPSCVDFDYVTLETANSAYGVLNGLPSNYITQSFQTSTATIRKTATINHVTRAL